MQNTPKENKECCKCNGKEPEIVSSGTGKIDGHICFCSCHKMNTPKTIEDWQEEFDTEFYRCRYTGDKCLNCADIPNIKIFIKKLLSEQDRISRESEREEIRKIGEKVPDATVEEFLELLGLTDYETYGHTGLDGQWVKTKIPKTKIINSK